MFTFRFLLSLTGGFSKNTHQAHVLYLCGLAHCARKKHLELKFLMLVYFITQLTF